MTWDPQQYDRFAAERAQPFHDLLGLVQPVPGGEVVDLGCGPGSLTALLPDALQAAVVRGLDTSPAMLAEAEPRATDRLRFAQGDLATFGPPDQVDVVFSNAALHWVADHPAVLARWRRALRPGGQLAVQVPANAGHPSHVLAHDVAGEEPFASAIGANAVPDVSGSVLAPEDYAQVLADLGFVHQHVRLQVYGHWLADTAEVVEWVNGTTLNRYRAVLPAELHQPYLDRYRTVLVERLGDRSPFFYPFKRILFWARLP